MVSFYHIKATFFKEDIVWSHQNEVGFLNKFNSMPVYEKWSFMAVMSTLKAEGCNSVHVFSQKVFICNFSWNKPRWAMLITLSALFLAKNLLSHLLFFKNKWNEGESASTSGM